MGQELTRVTPVAEVCTTIAGTEFKGKIAQAIPPGVSVERFVRTTLTAVQQNPEVVVADRGSLYNSVIRAAQDGLLPDGREAALVIFNTKDGKKVQYLPMIGGLRKRAAEHGFAIDAFLVYAGDAFHYELGFEPIVVHRPPRLGDERGEVIGAYAVATRLSDGRKFLEPPMTVAEIEAIRARSRAKDKGPWVTDWGEMARKTAARRLFKSLPLIADEATVRVLEATDDEYELPGKRMSLAEANVAAAIGPVGPPAVDTEKPDDTPPAAAGSGGPDGGDPIDVEAVDVTDDEPASSEPEEEPRAGQPSPSAEPTVAPADAPPAVESASSSGTPADEEQASIFEQMAETAQAAQKKQQRAHRDPAA